MFLCFCCTHNLIFIGNLVFLVILNLLKAPFEYRISRGFSFSSSSSALLDFELSLNPHFRLRSQIRQKDYHSNETLKCYY